MREQLFLLGHPVSHSKSPAMHNALYQECGLDWEYALFDAPDKADARAFLSEGAFLAANITTPYKPLAFEAARIQAATAKLALGANVLVRKNGENIAYNVDGQGCVGFLEKTGFSFADAQVVVCGTGPTALSVVHAASVAGAEKVVLVGRDKEKTRGVLEGFATRFSKLAFATLELPAAQSHHRSMREAYDMTDFSFASYSSAPRVFGEADLVVNATPLGMSLGDRPPFDPRLLHEGQTVLDVVYGHGVTELAAGAQAAGCTVFDGRGMLVGQAVASARIFFDLAGVNTSLSDSDMFAIMSRAAGFE